MVPACFGHYIKPAIHTYKIPSVNIIGITHNASVPSPRSRFLSMGICRSQSLAWTLTSPYFVVWNMELKLRNALLEGKVWRELQKWAI